MANPHRGSVALQVGDRVYTLSLSTNAMCEIEDHFGGKPIGEIASGLSDPENVSITTLRAIVWASLLDHHPDMDLKDAGKIMTEAGMANVLDAIGQAFTLAFPAEAKGPANPRKAAKA